MEFPLSALPDSLSSLISGLDPQLKPGSPDVGNGSQLPATVPGQSDLASLREAARTLAPGQSILELSTSRSDYDRVEISRAGRAFSIEAYSKEAVHLQIEMLSRGKDGSLAYTEIDIQAIRERYVGISGTTPEGDSSAAPGETGVQGLLDRLMDEFSPEKTADRIFDFATKGFHPEEDTPGSFRDFILPWIEKGYQQAREDLGSLLDQVETEIARTMELVRERFDAFAGSEAEPVVTD
ncbi:MAG: DUF5610 domain-containing protein [Planctomycetota bacterium]